MTAQEQLSIFNDARKRVEYALYYFQRVLNLSAEHMYDWSAEAIRECAENDLADKIEADERLAWDKYVEGSRTEWTDEAFLFDRTEANAINGSR